VADAFHRLVLASRDFVASRLAHLRRVRPVVLACQHVHGALLGVDAGHAAAAVPAAWWGLVNVDFFLGDGNGWGDGEGVEVDVNERGREREIFWLGLEVRHTVTTLAFCKHG
jgi:hypothetical protein